MTNQLIDKLKLSQSDEQTAAIAVLGGLSIALLAVSFAAIFIRVSELELGPNATIFNRLWIATAAIGLWNLLKTGKDQLFDNIANENLLSKSDRRKSLFPDTSREFLLLLAVGIVSSTSLVFWAWSLTQTTVANSMVIRNLTPIFTTLGSWLFLGQVFRGRFLIGMAIALGGAISLGVSDFSYGTENLLGDIAALFSAMFYGINLLIVEQLRAKLSATKIIFWRCFLGTVFVLPMVLFTEERLFPYSGMGWFAVISLAVVCQVLGQGLLVYSLKRLSSALVALFLLLEPVITALLAWAIFAESLSFVNWVGFFVVLLGIYLAKSGQSD